MAAYQRKFPLGTRQRVWLDVILFMGPRRGDASRIGRQHVKEVRNEDDSVSRVATWQTEKSGETITVTRPILDVLQRTLDAGPTGDLTWVCGARGLPFTKESFGNAFSEALDRRASKRAPTACVRSLRRSPLRTARPLISSWRFSDGPIFAKLRSTPAKLGAPDWPREVSVHWTKPEHLFPHLRERCGR